MTATAFNALARQFLRARWRPVAIGVVSLLAMFTLGMAVYRDLDATLFEGLPAGWKSLIGLPEGADVAALSYNAIYSTYGALILGGLAIALGSASFAGSERDGTIGILLANPVSRTLVLLSRTLVLLVLFALSGVFMWFVAITLPVLLDVNIDGLALGGFTAQLVIGVAFYGFVAMAISGWTGNSTLGSGAAAGVMVLSFFGAGLLPVISGWEEWARIFPWYYISSGDPLTNGIDSVAVTLMLGLSVLLVFLALLGINRRDLTGRSVGGGVIKRLRAIPLTEAVSSLTGRFTSGSRVSSIMAKTLNEYRILFLLVAIAMFLLMGIAMGPIFATLQPTIAELDSSIPESFLVFFGGGILGTPEGFFQVETFGLMAPIAIMVVTISLGARAIAGEEANRTLGILLANPITRGFILRQKLTAMGILGFGVAASVFLGVSGANLISDLGMNYIYIAAVSVNLFLLGATFGAFALLLGAAIGRVGVALGGAAGATIALHVLNSLAELNDSWWGVLSPFHFYLGTDPLNQGFNVPGLLILTGICVILGSAAFPLFARRDLRG